MNDINLGWQIDAACQHLSKDLFFPEHGKRLPKEAVDACLSCPVKEACLNHALHYEEYGYWGATTVTQRRAMRKELGIELITLQSILSKQNRLDETCIEETV
jgi:Transcription factor WhiB